ncbi:hypothetical protein H8E07_13525 [bacterium]|nr:hypothetical protein [bacterium]
MAAPQFGLSQPIGYRKRTDREEMRLRVMLLLGTHGLHVAQKAQDELGERGGTIGPLDLSCNPALRYATTLSTANTIPSAVSGMDRELSTLIGDSSSVSLYEKYQRGGYLPMPTTQRRTSRRLEPFLVFCHYAGVYVGFSEDHELPYMKLITPDALTLDYELDDPTRPSVYRHDVRRRLGSSLIDVTDVYDLRDPAAPRYRVMRGNQDITKQIMGRTYDGLDQWPEDWLQADGTPAAPIIVYGQADDISRGMELVESSLRVMVGWSWWWAGLRDTCFKGRNVRGMTLDGMDSQLDPDGEGKGHKGIATGAEDVLRWRDDDPDKAGEHWQWDAPFDAEKNGRAISDYESRAISRLGVAIDYSHTGGEPLAHEVAERKAEAHKHYDDLRAGDASVLARVATICNRRLGTSFATAGYGVSYDDEIEIPAVTEEATNERRTDPAGPERNPGGDQEVDGPGADTLAE